jgi:hypothetical protein
MYCFPDKIDIEANFVFIVNLDPHDRPLFDGSDGRQTSFENLVFLTLKLTPAEPEPYFSAMTARSSGFPLATRTLERGGARIIPTSSVIQLGCCLNLPLPPQGHMVTPSSKGAHRTAPLLAMTVAPYAVALITTRIKR